MVEWCCIIYDKPNVDRSATRPQHLANLPVLIKEGKLISACPLYHDVINGSPTNFAGSHLIISADTKEEALEVIYSDIFAKKGIWDLDNIIILPTGASFKKQNQP